MFKDLKYIFTLSDIDECNDETHNCHGNATCTNTNGTFICTCDVGFTGDGVACTGMAQTW